MASSRGKRQPTRDQLLRENKRLRAENAKLRMALSNASESIRATLEVLRIERETRLP